MKCNDCYNHFSRPIRSAGFCKCGTQIIHDYKLCKKCSKSLNLCEICGKNQNSISYTVKPHQYYFINRKAIFFFIVFLFIILFKFINA